MQITENTVSFTGNVSDLLLTFVFDDIKIQCSYQHLKTALTQ